MKSLSKVLFSVLFFYSLSAVGHANESFSIDTELYNKSLSERNFIEEDAKEIRKSAISANRDYVESCIIKKINRAKGKLEKYQASEQYKRADSQRKKIRTLEDILFSMRVIELRFKD